MDAFTPARERDGSGAQVLGGWIRSTDAAPTSSLVACDAVVNPVVATAAIPGRVVTRRLPQQLGGADQRVQLLEIQHALPLGRRGLVLLQAAVVALQRVRDRARGAARKDDDAKPDAPEFARGLHRRLAALDHVREQGDAAGEA